MSQYIIVNYHIARNIPDYLPGSPRRGILHSSDTGVGRHVWGLQSFSEAGDAQSLKDVEIFLTCQSLIIFGLILKILSVRTIKYAAAEILFFVSLNEFLSVKSFGLTLFGITVSKIEVARPGFEPWTTSFASQELNHSTTTTLVGMPGSGRTDALQQIPHQYYSICNQFMFRHY